MEVYVSHEELFAGTPDFFGGISNQIKLTKICPPFFREDNEWSRYSRIFQETRECIKWKWKTDSTDIRRKQLACLNALLNSKEISTHSLHAIGGWMLSEMITEIPS